MKASTSSGPASVPRLHEIAVDGRRAAVHAAAVRAVGVAVRPRCRRCALGRLDLHDTLKDAGRGRPAAGAVWGRGQNVRRLLVVSELALVGDAADRRRAARFAASCTCSSVPPGFNPAGVLTLELTMSGRKYTGRAGRDRNVSTAVDAARARCPA